MTVLFPPNGRQAKPMRGANNFLLGSFNGPFVSTAGNRSCLVKSKLRDWPPMSVIGELYSYRTPMFTVNRDVSLISSVIYVCERQKRVRGNVPGSAPGG